MRHPTALTAVGLLALTSCGAEPEDRSEAPEGSGGDTVTVFAAASLHTVFEQIGELYTQETGTAAEFSFAGSSGLVEQLQNGAPADVLATADQATMESAMDSGLLAGEPELFAGNILVIVTAAGNPAGVESLGDLQDDSVETILCAEQVPCGAASRRAMERADVEIAPVSEELSVTDVLGRVRTGEADAGLVYATDAFQAGNEVQTVEIEDSARDPNLYPIAALEDAASPEPAREFIDFMLGEPEAQRLLEDAGFSQPQDGQPQ